MVACTVKVLNFKKIAPACGGGTVFYGRAKVHNYPVICKRTCSRTFVPLCQILFCPASGRFTYSTTALRFLCVVFFFGKTQFVFSFANRAVLYPDLQDFDRTMIFILPIVNVLWPPPAAKPGGVRGTTAPRAISCLAISCLPFHALPYHVMPYHALPYHAISCPAIPPSRHFIPGYSYLTPTGLVGAVKM